MINQDTVIEEFNQWASDFSPENVVPPGPSISTALLLARLNLPPGKSVTDKDVFFSACVDAATTAAKEIPNVSEEGKTQDEYYRAKFQRKWDVSSAGCKLRDKLMGWL